MVATKDGFPSVMSGSDRWGVTLAQLELTRRAIRTITPRLRALPGRRPRNLRPEAVARVLISRPGEWGRPDGQGVLGLMASWLACKVEPTRCFAASSTS